MEIYFAMAIRMLLLYMKPLFLSVFHFFGKSKKNRTSYTILPLEK